MTTQSQNKVNGLSKEGRSLPYEQPKNLIDDMEASRTLRPARP
jgi:hypothetical protein